MNKIIETIESAKHIELVATQENISVATALYTYILTQHKKVSLVLKEGYVESKYSFLPWFEKIKSTPTPSADCSIVIKLSALELYNIFKSNAIKINNKMATSLYSALLVESEGFKTTKVDGTLFAVCSELIAFGADYKVATEVIVHQLSLSELRLKSLMLKEMKLVDSATTSQFSVSDLMLQESGADIEIAKRVIKEGLRLPYVTKTILINEKLELILKIEKEI